MKYLRRSCCGDVLASRSMSPRTLFCMSREDHCEFEGCEFGECDQNVTKERLGVMQTLSTHNAKINDKDEDGDKETLYYCEKDIRVHTVSCDRLIQTGWYYQSMSSPEAKKLLKHHPVGTFLIRDSSDPKFLYSVSVKTPRGTTSVRIIYHRGTFQLDCEDKIRNKMPKFDCVVRLVDFYVRLSLSDRNHICRWLESSGRKDLPISLKKPRLEKTLDLKHLCRLAITRSFPLTTNVTKVKKCVDSLPVPGMIKDYLKDYPYLN
ncbi:hypothetical protein FSP39_018101 [Pinctada imbricata]|uniref:Cytokine-inducible SH2-containing protein n=1 Tax=Pinctada imbricata TaxID=66713 RepID=A0AA89BQ46_PINIB|nr:hypothetical protein FSP39_018101 [Pinctada imbricata]